MAIRRRLLGYEVDSHEWGTDQGGPTVVLVHGIGVSSRYFGPLVRELVPTSRVVAPDLPGFGTSPDPDHVLSVAENADVVAALLDELDVRRAVLVGHSMGVQFVTEVALRRPELAGALVLLSPVTDPDARSGTRQALRLARDAFHEPLRGLLVQIREWLRCGVRRYAATIPHMRDYPLGDRLSQVALPVVVVRGTQDPVSPSGYVHRLARRAKDARVVEVPGAAHLVMYSRPETVAALCPGVRC